MKKFRKLTAMVSAIVLAGCVATSFCMGVSAEEATTYSITVNAPNGTTASGTYKAYQVFAGTCKTVGETQELTVTGWGTGVDGTALLTELQKTKFSSGNADFANCTDPAGVADVLSKFSDNSEDANLFAKVVAKHLGTGIELTASKATTGFAVGYYLIAGGNGNSITGNILELAGGNLTVDLKIGTPTVIKKVYEDTKSDNEKGDKEDTSISGLKIDPYYNDIADYDINETVKFELYGTLPSNYSSYTAYRYIFHDTLDSQFTISSDTANVEVYAVNTTAGEDDEDGNPTTVTTATKITAGYNVDITTDEKTGISSIVIKFTDLKKATTDATIDENTVIKVKYDAVLNDTANVGLPGQDNDVYLEYSNNPNWNGQGRPTTENDGNGDTSDDSDNDGYEDTPTESPSGNGDDTTSDTGSDDTPRTPTDETSDNGKGDGGNTDDTTGTTKKDTVRVFTYQVDVTKVDGKSPDTKLSGAVFKLYKYVKGSDGEYITDEKGNKVKYYVTTKEGTRNNATVNLVTGWTDESSTKGTEFTTGTDGKIIVTGLDDDTYYLEEVTAPDGYNKPTKDAELVISATTSNVQDWTTAQNDGLTKLEYTLNGDTTKEADTEKHGTVSINVENNKGTSLPSTGGIGTTMFYVTGGVLVAGAGVTLIAKKRMKDAQ
jgi:LPXTG-motif cell wall-anchored protein